MASRNLDDLLPEVAALAREHALACAKKNIELLIYCTLRDAAEQARLYCQGRTPEQIQECGRKLLDGGFPQLAALLDQAVPQPGSKVTFAGPGESYHQYGLAYDCVPIVGGKCLWKTSGDAAAVWSEVGRLGKEIGLEWAGEWTRFKEFPHFQKTGGKSVAQLMRERYTASASAVLTTADLLPESESDALLKALAEPATVFLVLASVPGVSGQVLAEVHAKAGVVRNLNAQSWRVFWAKQPDQLSAPLRTLLWAGAKPSVGTVLSLGTGLARQAKPLKLDEIDDEGKLFHAFSWVP